MLKILLWVIFGCMAVSVKAAIREECLWISPYEITMTDEQIEFRGVDLGAVSFRSNIIVREGNALTLNPSESMQASAFRNRTRRMLPLLSDLTEKNAQISVAALTQISKNVLQLNGKEHTAFMAPITQLVDQIRKGITPSRFDPSVLKLDFTDTVSLTFSAILSALFYETKTQFLSFFSNEQSNDPSLASRIENFETWLEATASTELIFIETKANYLCSELQHLVKLDQSLRQVNGYPEAGLIQKFESENLDMLDYYSLFLQPGGIESLILD